MTRYCDSSVASPASSDDSRNAGSATPDSSTSSSDESLIMIMRDPPRVFGMNLSVFLILFYLFEVTTGALHLALIVQASVDIGGSYLITIMFGLLSPISCMYWFLSVLFIAFGARMLFSPTRDYYKAASHFRRWSRVTRYLFVSWIMAMTQFLFGCYMFVKGTSLSHNIGRTLDLKGIPRKAARRKFAEAVARNFDSLVYSNSNTALKNPLNILYTCGNKPGFIIPLLVCIPLAVIVLGIRTQEKYYNWRFARTNIRID